MSAGVKLLAVPAVALAVCAAAVFGLGDGRTLVSAPEVVAEDFVHAIRMERYSQAARHLSEEARARTGEDALAGVRSRLEGATGGIEDVRGEAGWIAGEKAEAVAVLRGRRAPVRVGVRMARENGEWRVTGMDGPTR